MGTTPALALRYPAATDRVADGALAIQHLAEDVEAKLKLAYDPPRAKVYQSAAQTLNNGALTLVTFTSEEVDDDGLHSIVANTSRITVAVAGWYEVLGQISYAANATGIRRAMLLKNGATFGDATAEAVDSGGHIMQVHGETLCAAGDYLELQGYQSSGGNLLLSTGAGATFLHAKWSGA